jgi:hypothetical protein
VVSTVTRLWAGRERNRLSISGRVIVSSSSLLHPDRCEAVCTGRDHFLRCQRGLGLKLINIFHLRPNLSILAALPPLPLVPSWCAQMWFFREFLRNSAGAEFIIVP